MMTAGCRTVPFSSLLFVILATLERPDPQPRLRLAAWGDGFAAGGENDSRGASVCFSPQLSVKRLV
jgi:hypothetical protein